MKSVPFSTLVLGSALVSIATVYSTDLPARDKSSQGASVSAGGVSVSADRGGASVSTGGASASADRGGASVSAGGASASADQGGASGSSGVASASADRGGASVSGGGSVSADRGGANVSAGRGDTVGSEGDMQAHAVQAAARGKPVGDRSYDSIGEWFEDLRTSWFGGKRKGAEVVTEEVDTTTQSSATHTTETSDDGQTQVNRVTQKQSSTEIATDGGSASAEASNVSHIKQKN